MSKGARMTRIVIVLAATGSLGATHRTPNFTVQAPTAKVAKQVAVAAEHYRKKLALEWLGKYIPRWYAPCHVMVKVDQVRAGGATSFKFNRGHVYGWKMEVQGPLHRILDAVLPHEITHTILACHFRRPLPRWADEGAATLSEDDSEKRRQTQLVEQVLKTTRRIPLRTLLSIKRYPHDMQNVLTLYAEGYSLAAYLIQQGGKARYLLFLEDAYRRGWDRSIHCYYGAKDVDELEYRWNAWVMAGSPTSKLADGELLADTKTLSAQPNTSLTDASESNTLQPNLIVRSQTPERSADSGGVVQLASALHSTPSRSFQVPNRDAAHIGGHSPIRRGEGLYAPDPRQQQPIRPITTRPRRQTRRSNAAPTTGFGSLQWDINRHRPRAAGSNQARSDGWIAISESRRPPVRQQSLIGKRSGRVLEKFKKGQIYNSARYVDWSDFLQRPVRSESIGQDTASRVALFSRKPSH